jgi:hypothetical protein
MPYTDKLDPEVQVDAEESIASILFDSGLQEEEFCATLSRAILQTVLAKFRPDLCVEE